MRDSPFIIAGFYHIYNRGVDKRKVFLREWDYERFLASLILLNNEEGDLMIRWRDACRKNRSRIDPVSFLKLNFRKPLDKIVDIIAYCLNPNHFHLVLKQLKERGIEKFMQKVGTSHTKYFNEKNKRDGALFQGRFKSRYIEANEYLLYLSAYVNRNYFIHGLGNDYGWPFSSLSDYIGRRRNGFCNTEIILSQFKKLDDYKKLLKESGRNMRFRKKIEKYLIEQ